MTRRGSASLPHPLATRMIMSLYLSPGPRIAFSRFRDEPAAESYDGRKPTKKPRASRPRTGQAARLGLGGKN